MNLPERGFSELSPEEQHFSMERSVESGVAQWLPGGGGIIFNKPDMNDPKVLHNYAIFKAEYNATFFDLKGDEERAKLWRDRLTYLELHPPVGSSKSLVSKE